MLDPHGAQVEIGDVFPFELEDASSVIAAAYMEYSFMLPPGLWAKYRNDMQDVHSRLEESELIVARSSGRIVGAVTFYKDGVNYGPPDWPLCWAGLRLLAVHPDSRGLGIGRALTEECIERCRGIGVRTIGLHNMKDMVIARGMYERIGFDREPRFDRDLPGGLLVMAYKLV